MISGSKSIKCLTRSAKNESKKRQKNRIISLFFVVSPFRVKTGKKTPSLFTPKDISDNMLAFFPAYFACISCSEPSKIRFWMQFFAITISLFCYTILAYISGKIYLKLDSWSSENSWSWKFHIENLRLIIGDNNGVRPLTTTIVHRLILVVQIGRKFCQLTTHRSLTLQDESFGRTDHLPAAPTRWDQVH